MENENIIGGAWLAKNCDIKLVQPLHTISRIGGRRASQILDSMSTETYVESMRPSPTIRGHLSFHLKHETPNLELLSKIFATINPQDLVHWITEEPSGQYAKRACFLYEFLTGHTLKVDVEVTGAYIPVIDEHKLVAATPEHSRPNTRWRVRDNLPGTRNFCPMIRKTEPLLQAMRLDIAKLMNDLALEFGTDLLMRSAVWMTLRESKSSFAIEGESNRTDRIQRFADVLSRLCGQGSLPFSQETLSELQAEILGTSTSIQHFGIRQSPVFVGSVTHYQQVVHYIAPPAQDISAMLHGLATFLERTQGQSPVMRSAVAAFGFVYIPISSFITSDQTERQTYDRILDTISRPLMQSLSGYYEFTSTHTPYPDGIFSNFLFHGDDQARATWQHLDLTTHVLYLARVLEHTIQEGMRNESLYLRCHAQAKAAVKDIIEMPDLQIDRIIRSVEVNQGKLSNNLSKEIPRLQDPEVWSAIVEAITIAFQDAPRL